MLSIGKLGNANYHISLAQKDYHLKGGEPEGEWTGGGAARLGLTGAARPRHFRSLFAGSSPVGKKLVQNSGCDKRRAGWDLVFTAPKIVSLLWVFLPKEQQRCIQAAHKIAVHRAIQYLEKELIYVRRGKQGTNHVQATGVYALFEHASSRLLDPNLHTHAVLFNLGFAKGRWGAIDGKRIYTSKMLLGAIYRTELAHQLWNDLGLPFKQVRHWIDVDGVLPERLVQFFSKRSQEIRSAMRLFGSRSAKASDVANLRTRESKRQISRPELFTRWRREAKSLGYDREYFKSLFQGGRLASATGEASLGPDGLGRMLDSAIRQSIQSVSAHLSHFSKRDLLRVFLPLAGLAHASVDRALATFDRAIQSNSDLIKLKPTNGELRFTTRANLELEKSLMSQVEALKSQAANKVSSKVVDKHLVGGDLSEEQMDAVKYLVQGPGRIKMLAGGPGTRKTMTIAAAYKILKQAGFKVRGTAIAGKAARNLEEKSKVKSHTVARLSKDLNAGLLQDLAHHGRQLMRAAFGLPTYRLHRIKLTPKTVLVVDEAAMLDTKTASELLDKVAAAGASIVLVGDENQLPPIGVGAPFASIKRQLPHASLTQIRRLKHAQDIEALKNIAAGEPQKALQQYADRQLLFAGDNRNAAIEKLLADWSSSGGISRPQEHMILVATNEERQRLNQEAQRLRQDHKAVAREGQLVNGELLAKGDRVMFLANHSTLAVSNGDIGTVIASGRAYERSLSVMLDSGKTIDVPLDQYDQLTLGYAATVHKFQGSDLLNTYALLGGSMQSREFTFTQLSRHQETCRLYTDKLEAGEKLEHLHRQMATQIRECLAIDLLPSSPSPPPEPDGSINLHPRSEGVDAELNGHVLDPPRVRLQLTARKAAQLGEPTAPGELPSDAVVLSPLHRGAEKAQLSAESVTLEQPTNVPENKLAERAPKARFPSSRNSPANDADASPLGEKLAVPIPQDQKTSLSNPGERDVWQNGAIIGEPRSSAAAIAAVPESRPKPVKDAEPTLASDAHKVMGRKSSPEPIGPAQTTAIPAERSRQVGESQDGRETQAEKQLISQQQVPRSAGDFAHARIEVKSPVLETSLTPLNRDDFQNARSFNLHNESLPPIRKSLAKADESRTPNLGLEIERSAPRLFLVVSNDQSPARSPGASDDSLSKKDALTKRVEETFLEREHRLIRQLDERKAHEHPSILQTDAARFGPKPS